ncbi:sigma 54-interacting transcriptional regulator [Thalassotalea sp. ND16A]|uniref:sigma 54-interacting transcriptional regulator n=1 Tax=Thalassotalea sp. ND16A TaxID=1535422 RepID=UPI00051CC755|nr:sigma 54-interacting transcriptional regulator [Thalassotalea sp. ND16A]KGJ99683.1 response regulator receiver protein [Thalassotalea sp. ND16A]
MSNIEYQLLLVSHSVASAQFIDNFGTDNIKVDCYQQSIEQLIETKDDANYHLVCIDSDLIPPGFTKQQLCGLLNTGVVFVHFGQHHDLNANALLYAQCDYDEINWPTTKAQLHNSMQMALYKLQVRRRQTNQNDLLTNTVSCIGDVLIYLDQQGDITTLNETAQQLFAVDEAEVRAKPWYTVLKIRPDMSSKQTQQFIATAIKIQTVTKIQPFAIQTTDNSSQLVDGIIGPIKYPNGNNGVVLILRQLSSLDKIPNALALNTNANGKSVKQSAVSGILLLSPDYFNQINLRYGREFGDKLLYAIGELIRHFVRPTDLSSHYGGTMFMIMFAESSAEQIKNIVNKLHIKLSNYAFFDEKIKLPFSFGVSVNSEELSYSPVELFYYANFSLSQARDLGGAQVRQWQQLNTMLQIGNLDRLSGNVSKTGNSDYQKMLMQWSILNYLDDIEQPRAFYQALLMQLINGFELAAAGLYKIESDNITLLQAIDHNEHNILAKDIIFSQNQRHFISQLSLPKTQQGQENQIFTTVLKASGIELILPVNTNLTSQYFLWLNTEHDDSIQVRDNHTLYNIADYVGVKIEQFAIHKLPPALANNQLDFWYRSFEMEQLMAEVAMVAPTNATVLITGESGTGKEMLAKSIHLASQRKDKPFVIFDCAAVVESLIESELFGHKKGAFTGADKNVNGCVQQADGGTLFLDEIGELPIEMQVKLLRFVQEKQYSPVGSGKYKKVDVRLIAATNVDLQQQIKIGKFREDLYFRLNVFSLKNIPLRQRKSDILLIALSYLKVFAKEYNKVINDFSNQAKLALVDYQWPGNIRELKNLVHRAVIVGNEELLQCKHLALYPSTAEQADQSLIKPETSLAVTTNNDHVVNKADVRAMYQPAILNSENIINAQQEHINVPATEHTLPLANRLISACIATDNHRHSLAISPWVEFLLYQHCLENNQQVAIQAANQLNIAESTFRRRWKKLQSVTAPQNLTVVELAERFAKQVINIDNEQSKIQMMQTILANACNAQRLAVKLSSSLLDVSAPTLRRLLSSAELTKEKN